MYNVGNLAIPALNQFGNLDHLFANYLHYALANSLGLDLTSICNLVLKSGTWSNFFFINSLSGIYRLYYLGIISHVVLGH